MIQSQQFPKNILRILLRILNQVNYVKFCLPITLFLTFSTPAFTQTEIEKKLIGTWSVMEVRSTLEEFKDLDEEEIDEAKEAIEAFRTSKFIFGLNNQFQFEIDFLPLENENLIWEFDRIKRRIIIEDKIDIKNGIYLEIDFLIRDKDLYFGIIDTPFSLRLQKD